MKQGILIPPSERHSNIKVSENEVSISNEKFKKYKSLSLFKPATERMTRTESR
jgi:hypothetical protein